MFQAYYQSHRTPTHYYTMRLLTLAVFPLAIYFLQMLGKIYSLAAVAAGILIFVKVLLDLLVSHSVPQNHSSPAPRRTLTHQSPPCQLCGNANKILVPHPFDSRHLWVCHDCHSCMKFTEQYA